MNGVRVLTVKSAASGDRFQCSDLSDWSLSKHLYILYIYIYQLYISYHMNGVRVLTVKSAASGDRVQCSDLSDWSLLKHLYILYIYIYISIIYMLSYERCACFDSEKCC